MKILLTSAFRDNLIILEFDSSKELNDWLKDHKGEHTPFFEKLRNVAPVAVVGAVMDAMDVQSTTAIPVCPDHGVPMRKSAKGENYYCSKKTPIGFCLYRCKPGGKPYKAPE